MTSDKLTIENDEPSQVTLSLDGRAELRIILNVDTTCRLSKSATMVEQMNAVAEKVMRWTPRLVKRLRGKRTLADFGALIGAPKNTVWRWEAGQSQPDTTYTERLSDLAKREHFLKDWKLVGSMTLVGDLESAKGEIADLFRNSVRRTARHLTE